MSKRGDIDLLLKRVGELEQQVAHLSGLLDRDRPARAEAARPPETAVAGRRFDISLNTIYRAEADGYVTVTFVGGRTGRVRILAGRTSPPTEPVSVPGTEYTSGLIRRGEYWTVATVPPGRKPAFLGIFTPLY